MTNFVGRQPELAELHNLTSEPGSQFMILYGRRRVGKTTVVRHPGAQADPKTLEHLERIISHIRRRGYTL